MTRPKTEAASRKGAPSPGDRLAFLDSPAGWDWLFGGVDAPKLELSFEGDRYTWEQLKERAVAQGMDPRELLRFALYLYLEGPGGYAAARARSVAYREWQRTKPTRIIDGKGVRWVPSDRLIGELTSEMQREKPG